ncbi:META domain-containing protein [Sulfitobacter sp. JB4-11]|uniref:META domain-containing protein n=1 Tax=Sulfitobacter rhodophyticola TaxID=3238304 RepID=UPI0035114B0B
MGVIVFIVVMGMAFQNQDQTVRAYGADDHIWQVTELRGAPFPARATLQFPRIGQITGTGPCNTYQTGMHTPYPWFGVDGIISTKRACPDLALEAAFFAALQEASLSEVGPDTLTLSNEAGDVLLVFKHAD